MVFQSDRWSQSKMTRSSKHIHLSVPRYKSKSCKIAQKWKEKSNNWNSVISQKRVKLSSEINKDVPYHSRRWCLDVSPSIEREHIGEGHWCLSSTWVVKSVDYLTVAILACLWLTSIQIWYCFGHINSSGNNF